MFKWPDSPSTKAKVHELADYAELQCWKTYRISRTSLNQDLSREADHDYSEGVLEEEAWTMEVDETIAEMRRRRRVCQGGYPFVVDDTESFACYDTEADPVKSLIYLYLLLATRLDMSRDRTHDDIDGAHLFEELAAEATQAYLGPKAEKYVFGAHSQSLPFCARVKELCNLLGEGKGFRRNDYEINAQDDKLDIVVWKPFSDTLPGQLIAFGQCKTGTTYKDTLSQLQPDVFCGRWMQTQPAVLPLRFFLLADAVPQEQFDFYAREAGILIDRCRITTLCKGISGNVMAQIRRWTAAAAIAHNLSPGHDPSCQQPTGHV